MRLETLETLETPETLAKPETLETLATLQEKNLAMPGPFSKTLETDLSKTNCKLSANQVWRDNKNS